MHCASSTRALLGLGIARLDDFVEVLLKVSKVVRNEAERVVQREPLNIRGILIEISALAIEFGENRFDFHGCAE